mgnify:CR=1 FL=1
MKKFNNRILVNSCIVKANGKELFESINVVRDKRGRCILS